MTTGYQQPRSAHRNNRSNRSGAGRIREAVVDLSETELAELFELPGAETAPEELEVEILAQQADEFTCSSCFLVRHRSQLAREKSGQMYCRDCEG